jgi:GT2 family glycosyltransferase
VVQPHRSGSRLSILTPVFNPPETAFEACIASVLGQTSADWEWCLVDDGSTAPHVRPRLEALARADRRVHVEFAERNDGIVAATNRALSLASGDVVAFLDHDDELVDVAVERMLETFAADPSVGIAYSDEYLIDQDGNVIAAYDKPDFSPERLRSHNYFAHLVAVDREYAVASGGLRDGFDGAQDNDFDLRAVEHFGGAIHIPERLYRWRAVAGSVAADPAAKPSTLFSAERSLREHLERTGIDAGTTSAPDVHFSFRLHRPIRGTPLVTFVVRAEDGAMPSFVGDAIREGEWSRLEIVHVEGPGAAAVNAAASRARGDLLVVVDGDLRLVRGDLVRDVLPLAQDDDVAAVGPTLLLPDGSLAANGMTFCGGPEPVGFGSPASDVGPWGIYRVTREVSATPAVCFVARRDTFLDLGGLAESLPAELAGAHYGKRASRAGLRVLVTPFVQVGVSWSFEGRVSDDARRAWLERWGDEADVERFSPFDRIADDRRAGERWRHLEPLLASPA